VKPLGIDGAWLVTPTVHRDSRGEFLELYRSDAFTQATGYPFNLLQSSISVSAKNVVRGIHYAVPGQAKYVTCLYGSIIDVIVDIRVGSPTFGQFEMIDLNDLNRRAVYLSSDLGHGLYAQSDDATVLYLQSVIYSSDTERGIDPMDPLLGIDWPIDVPHLSARDLSAPTLAQARELGLLPVYRGNVT
jgi:dTDP-4-dehydrorhamnose 3,5-epimerase